MATQPRSDTTVIHRDGDLDGNSDGVGVGGAGAEPSIRRRVFWSQSALWSLSGVSAAVAVAADSSTIPTTASASASTGTNVVIAAEPPPPGATARVLSLALRSLPVSGCWALPVTLSGGTGGENTDDDNNNNNDEEEEEEAFYTYLAVVDTGSPFLTAPPEAERALRPTNKGGDQTAPGALASGGTNDYDDVSYEQYGSTVGGIRWKTAPFLTLVGNGEEVVGAGGGEGGDADAVCGANIEASVNVNVDVDVEAVLVEDRADVAVGIPSATVIEETGGIFFGLMTVDAARPTPLQQLGYDAFRLRFGDDSKDDHPEKTKRRLLPWRKTTKIANYHYNDAVTLDLWGGPQRDNDGGSTSSSSSSSEAAAVVVAAASSSPCLIRPSDPDSMQLFDLTPYGPNLHHYSVVCDRFECNFGEGSESMTMTFDCTVDGICAGIDDDRTLSLSRPLIAVFDTGLSGCIFSDTLWEDIRSQHQKRKTATEDDSEEKAGEEEGILPIGCTVWLPTKCHHGYHSSTPSSSSYDSSAASFASATSEENGTVRLSSVSDYWRFQSFRLPWWYADIAAANAATAAAHEERKTKNGTSTNTRTDNNYDFPHVVVLGSAFWRNPSVRELTIDTVSRRAKIATTTTTTTTQ
eukprot:jgi/Psemu1/57077/gm1.57077_g